MMNNNNRTYLKKSTVSLSKSRKSSTNSVLSNESYIFSNKNENLPLASNDEFTELHHELSENMIQHYNPARTKYFMKCPLWLIFLFQIIITIIIFIVIVLIMSNSEHEARIEAMNNYVNDVVHTVQNRILLLQSYVHSGKSFRTILTQNAKLLRCRDDDRTIETNKNLYLQMYALLSSSVNIVYVYIDQQSNTYFYPDKTPLITECGVGYGNFWNTVNDTLNNTYYTPSNITNNMYYDALEYKISLLHNDSNDIAYNYSLNDETYVKQGFKTEDFEMYTSIFQNTDYIWFLSLSIILSIPQNSTMAANDNKSAFIRIDIDTVDISKTLKDHTPDVNGAHATLYEIGPLYKVIAATSIPAFNITKKNESDNGIANFWVGGQTPDSEVNHDFFRAIKLCPTFCSLVSETNNEDVIAVDQIVISKDFVFLSVLSTPKPYYFGKMIASRNKTIVLCVIGVVMIILICLFIMFAIRSPIAKLKENMDLAAVMQNNKVVPTPSYLSEIQDLSESFNKMNAKLLVARTFMPEAYLVDKDDEDEEISEIEESNGNKGLVYYDNPSVSVFGDISSRPSRSTEDSNGQTFRTSSSAKEHEKTVLQRMALNNKYVAVLAINVLGFHKRVFNDTINAVHSTEQFLTTVQNSVVITNGVVDSYHGDHIIVTFNAAKNVASSGTRAIICALQIRDMLANTNISNLSMGAALGKALVGSMGNDKMKRFSVVGKPYCNAIKLEQASNRLERREGRLYGPFGCFINTSIASEVETTMDCQLVGQIFQQGGDHILAYAINKLPTEQKDDEWMYQLANVHKPFVLYNNALMSLLKRDLTSVEYEIEQHLKVVGGDACPADIKDDININFITNDQTNAIENNKLSFNTIDCLEESNKNNKLGGDILPPWERLSLLYFNLTNVLKVAKDIGDFNEDIFPLPPVLTPTKVSCWL